MGGNLHLRLLAPEPPRPGDAPRGHPRCRGGALASRCRTAALGEGVARAPRCRPRLTPAPGAERAGEPSALARACSRCCAGAASPRRRAAATRERREREEMHERARVGLEAVYTRRGPRAVLGRRAKRHKNHRSRIRRANFFLLPWTCWPRELATTNLHFKLLLSLTRTVNWATWAV